MGEQISGKLKAFRGWLGRQNKLVVYGGGGFVVLILVILLMGKSNGNSAAQSAQAQAAAQAQTALANVSNPPLMNAENTEKTGDDEPNEALENAQLKPSDSIYQELAQEQKQEEQDANKTQAAALDGTKVEASGEKTASTAEGSEMASLSAIGPNRMDLKSGDIYAGNENASVLQEAVKHLKDENQKLQTMLKKQEEAYIKKIESLQEKYESETNRLYDLQARVQNMSQTSEAVSLIGSRIVSFKQLEVLKDLMYVQNKSSVVLADVEFKIDEPKFGVTLKSLVEQKSAYLARFAVDQDQIIYNLLIKKEN